MSHHGSRNDECWCKSGKKYKKCHWEQDEKLAELARKGIEIPPRRLIRRPEQIEGVRKASRLTAQILDMVQERIHVGVTTEEIDQWVYDMTLANGGYPADLNYEGFPKSCCTSINQVICHGIPDQTKLKAGDIINVDITCELNGYYGDASRMFVMEGATEEARNLVAVTKECLDLGIQQVKPFNRIGDIAFAVEQHALKHGYSVVREFGGHGICDKMHDEPFVHHYGPRDRGMVLVPGMIITIEPMVNAGDFHLKILPDGWTVVTRDGSLSAQWEHTILVTEDGYEVLTVTE